MKLTNVGKLIGVGSSKNKHYVDGKTIDFRFKPTYSVFDVGIAPDEILGKDQSICACAVKSFEVAKKLGIPTHFIEQRDLITIRVHEAQIITDRPLTSKDEKFVVPAELIYRLFVAGSIDRDFLSGKKKPTDYGFPTDEPRAVGTPFPKIVHMTTTKFENVDRDINIEELCYMSGLSVRDLEELWYMIDILVLRGIQVEMAKAGYGVLDGKFECLMWSNRQKMIGDVFGTPDEDRLAPLDKLKKGVIEHYGKEHIRQIHIKSGYKKLLDEARDQNKSLPPIPRLSEEELTEASRRYAAVAEAYAGVKINL